MTHFHPADASTTDILALCSERTRLLLIESPSSLTFEIVEVPQPGQVKILLNFGGTAELLHLAANQVAAELWIAREGYRNARLEVVGKDAEHGRAGEADLAA